MTLYHGCKGFNDRLIITIYIKLSGYNPYSLDAQLDTREMFSCARFGAITEYYWKPIQTFLIVLNKIKIPIKGFAPYFPLYMNGVKTIVNLYNFDTGSDILLGHDFANKYLPMTVGPTEVTFTVQGKSIMTPSKESNENRV
jgi:hypothetical protein